MSNAQYILEATYLVASILFVLGQKVAKAGDATVHTRATHLFERDLLTSNHLRHARGT